MKGKIKTSLNMTSDKEQAQESSAWNEQRLRQLVENVEDYAIFVTNTDGLIENWNIGAEKLFGYTAAEAVGQHTRLIFTPEDCAKRVPEAEMKQARENGNAADERWHQRKDGSRFFASGFQTALYENSKLLGYAKIARDLTERVKLEEQLRSSNENLERKVGERTIDLQQEMDKRRESENSRIQLLRKLITTQEDERKRISRDLHDHLGQKVTALKLNLQLVKQKCDNNELIRLIERTQKRADELDAELDFLAWELRPASIDELGLEVTIKNFVREFSHHFKIPAQFQAKRLTKQRLVHEIEINLYRIAQEALNNIAKYAQATNVIVLMENPDHHVVLIVEDNGIGFDPQDKANKSKGLGLIGMAERVALIGGEIQIKSAKGVGTTVYTRVPVRFVNEE